MGSTIKYMNKDFVLKFQPMQKAALKKTAGLAAPTDQSVPVLETPALQHCLRSTFPVKTTS